MTKWNHCPHKATAPDCDDNLVTLDGNQWQLMPINGNQWQLSDMDAFNELELAEALLKAIASLIDEFYQTGVISGEEHVYLMNSVWFTLGFGTRLPK